MDVIAATNMQFITKNYMAKFMTNGYIVYIWNKTNANELFALFASCEKFPHYVLPAINKAIQKRN